MASPSPPKIAVLALILTVVLATEVFKELISKSLTPMLLPQYRNCVYSVNIYLHDRAPDTETVLAWTRVPGKSEYLSIEGTGKRVLPVFYQLQMDCSYIYPRLWGGSELPVRSGWTFSMIGSCDHTSYIFKSNSKNKWLAASADPCHGLLCHCKIIVENQKMFTHCKLMPIFNKAYMKVTDIKNTQYKSILEFLS